MKVINLLASYLESVRFHAEHGNDTEVENYSNAVYNMKKRLPQENGFDTVVSFKESSKDRVVLKCSYVPINPNGFYMDEVKFHVIVTPTFNLRFGFDAAIFYPSGQRESLLNSRKVLGNITDFLEDTYYNALDKEV